MKIKLLRNIECDGRPFTNGQVLTTKDISLGEMTSLVGTGWAVEVTGKVQVEPPAVIAPIPEPVGPNGSDQHEPQTDPTDPPIASMGFSKTANVALKKVGIETLSQAKAYMAEHGSLEPIKGVSKEVADKIAAL